MRRGHGVRLGDSYKRLWGAAKRGMREEWATAHIISQMWRHTAHTHTHTPVWKLSCRQVSSSRSGLVSQAPGFFFSSVFPSSSSFFVLFFCFKRFRYIYIYILGILLFIFFQRKVYTGKNKGNCFFLLLLLHPNSSSIHQGVSSSCLRAHTHNTRTSLLPINASTLPFPQPPFFFFLPFLILYFVWRKPYPTTVSLNKSIIFYKKK